MTPPPMDDTTVAFLAGLPRREYGPDELVLEQGGPPTLGIVFDGLVKGLVRPQHSNIEQAVLCVVGEGRWLGLECLEEDHILEYRTLTDTRLALIDRDVFWRDAPEAVLRTLLREAGHIIARTVHLGYIGRLELERRVLSRLCDLREATSMPEVRITREDLASLVGAHRNKVGEALKRLEARGLVECGYGEILVGQLEQLHAAWRDLGREAAARS